MTAIELPAARTTNTCAILSLVLALLGWNLLPVIGFVGAIICGRIAQRQLKQPGNTQDGHGLARAGIWISWISLILVALLIGVVIPLLTAPITVNLPVST
jgi:hypothetical protein